MTSGDHHWTSVQTCSLQEPPPPHQCWHLTGKGSCTLRSNASWVMVTWYPPPPTEWQTDKTESITFPQLRCRAVIITIPKLTDSWFMVLSWHAAGFLVTQSLGTVLTFLPLGRSIQALKAVTSQVYPAKDKQHNCILIGSNLCAWNSVNITFNAQTLDFRETTLVTTVDLRVTWNGEGRPPVWFLLCLRVTDILRVSSSECPTLNSWMWNLHLLTQVIGWITISWTT